MERPGRRRPARQVSATIDRTKERVQDSWAEDSIDMGTVPPPAATVSYQTPPPTPTPPPQPHGAQLSWWSSTQSPEGPRQPEYVDGLEVVNEDERVERAKYDGNHTAPMLVPLWSESGAVVTTIPTGYGSAPYLTPLEYDSVLSQPQHIIHDNNETEKIVSNTTPDSAHTAWQWNGSSQKMPVASLLADGEMARSQKLASDMPPDGEAQRVQETERPKWYKRHTGKIMLAIPAALMLLGIGLGVGLGIGMQQNHGALSGDPAPSNNGSSVRDFNSSCSNTFCHQTLAMADVSRKAYVFGRGADDSIQYRVWNWAGFDTGDWQTMQNSKGAMAGQPGALAWTPTLGTERLDLFAVTRGKNLVGQHLMSGAWSGRQTYVGPMQSQPVFCTVGDHGRMDMFIVDEATHTVLHNFWLSDATDFAISQWDTLIGDQAAASGVSVVCRDGTSLHDVFIYDSEMGSVKYNSWIAKNSSTATIGWTGWHDHGGSFVGDPLVVSFPSDPDRVDFFGVGTDGRMYHFTLASVFAQPTDLEDLGGSFASMPSVISPADGVMDVVAVNSTGWLLHRRFDGDSWSEDWEDMGVVSNSAPLAYTSDGNTALALLGENSDMLITSWPTSAEADWRAKAKTLQSAGGSFATDFSTMYAK